MVCVIWIIYLIALISELRCQTYQSRCWTNSVLIPFRGTESPPLLVEIKIGVCLWFWGILMSAKSVRFIISKRSFRFSCHASAFILPRNINDDLQITEQAEGVKRAWHPLWSDWAKYYKIARRVTVSISLIISEGHACGEWALLGLLILRSKRFRVSGFVFVSIDPNNGAVLMAS